jgi:amino acid permease
MTLNCLLALFIPNIGAAMTIVGCTINPIMGYLLPVFFYWKFIPNSASEKALALLNVTFTIVISALSIIQFVKDYIS